MLGYKAVAASKQKRKETSVQQISLPSNFEEVQEVPPLKRHRAETTPTRASPVFIFPKLLSPRASIQRSAPASPSLPSSTGPDHLQLRDICLDLQRPSLKGLVGHQPDIFLDFLRAPSPSWESIYALPPPLRDSAALLTRSWNEREQGVLAEMPVGEAIISAQLHCHIFVLHMMSVAEKVNFFFTTCPVLELFCGPNCLLHWYR